MISIKDIEVKLNPHDLGERVALSSDADIAKFLRGFSNAMMEDGSLSTRIKAVDRLLAGSECFERVLRVVTTLHDVMNQLDN